MRTNSLTHHIRHRGSVIGLSFATLSFQGRLWHASSIDKAGMCELNSMRGQVTARVHADRVMVIDWRRPKVRDSTPTNVRVPEHFIRDTRRAVVLKRMFKKGVGRGDFMM